MKRYEDLHASPPTENGSQNKGVHLPLTFEVLRTLVLRTHIKASNSFKLIELTQRLLIHFLSESNLQHCLDLMRSHAHSHEN